MGISSKSITGWWQLKYFLCSSRSLGKWSNIDDLRIFFKWVGEKPQPPTRYIYICITQLFEGILKYFGPKKKRNPNTFANLPSDTLQLLEGNESARGNHLAFRGTGSHDSPGGPQEVANLGREMGPRRFQGKYRWNIMIYLYYIYIIVCPDGYITLLLMSWLSVKHISNIHHTKHKRWMQLLLLNLSRPSVTSNVVK